MKMVMLVKQYTVNDRLNALIAYLKTKLLGGRWKTWVKNKKVKNKNNKERQTSKFFTEVTKFLHKVSCGFGLIHERNTEWKTLFLCNENDHIPSRQIYVLKVDIKTLNYVLHVFSVSNGEIIIVGGTKLWIFLMFSLLNRYRLSK